MAVPGQSRTSERPIFKPRGWASWGTTRGLNGLSFGSIPLFLQPRGQSTGPAWANPKVFPSGFREFPPAVLEHPVPIFPAQSGYFYCVCANQAAGGHGRVSFGLISCGIDFSISRALRWATQGRIVPVFMFTRDRRGYFLCMVAPGASRIGNLGAPGILARPLSLSEVTSAYRSNAGHLPPARRSSSRP